MPMIFMSAWTLVSIVSAFSDYNMLHLFLFCMDCVGSWTSVCQLVYVNTVIYLGQVCLSFRLIWCLFPSGPNI